MIKLTITVKHTVGQSSTLEHVKNFAIIFAIQYYYCSITFTILNFASEKMKGNDQGIQHIRGTECDIRVKSIGESEHLIRSPNYPDPYPRNTTCMYILDGMQGPKKLEQVSLEFHSFSVQSDFTE